MSLRLTISWAAFAATVFMAAPATAVPVDLGDTGGDQAFSTRQGTTAMTALVQTSGNFNDLGMIRWFAGNFAPRGFQQAAGQLLNISQHTALFAQLGTTYGGNGTTNFALPDLRNRSVVGTGGNFRLGATMGSETVTLNEGNLPGHTHNTGTGPSSSTGAGDSYNNMMPGIALDHELVTTGIYPFGGTGAPEDTIGFVTIDAAIDGDGATGFDSSKYLEARGETLRISQNDALFSLVGTIYGGDGRNTLGVPDTRDSLITGAGRAPGLLNRRLGQQMGTNDETLTVAEMPAHTHSDPDFGVTDVTGGSIAENNVQKELSMNWLIATQGNFPSRGPGGNGSFGDPFLGEIGLFAGTFAPRGWAFADGQLLPIAQNTALFAILGTQYGGDGRTTFALPDLRGRTPVGAGSVFQLGAQSGSDSISLTVNNLPSHRHSVDRVIPPTIPLPASLWLMLGAFGGLGLLRRRAA